MPRPTQSLARRDRPPAARCEIRQPVSSPWHCRVLFIRARMARETGVNRSCRQGKRLDRVPGAMVTPKSASHAATRRTGRWNAKHSTSTNAQTERPNGVLRNSRGTGGSETSRRGRVLRCAGPGAGAGLAQTDAPEDTFVCLDFDLDQFGVMVAVLDMGHAAGAAHAVLRRQPVLLDLLLERWPLGPAVPLCAALLTPLARTARLRLLLALSAKRRFRQRLAGLPQRRVLTFEMHNPRLCVRMRRAQLAKRHAQRRVGALLARIDMRIVKKPPQTRDFGLQCPHILQAALQRRKIG